jgi:hypothetical protein
MATTLVEEIGNLTRISTHGRGLMAISILAVRKIAIQILHKIKRAIPPKKIAPKNPNLRVRKRRRFTLIARKGPIPMLSQ